ncbi:hypothetical protein [Streptomyces sp. NBC_01451]|uniref:hypothetical protein n=1 Tax=Streptomyces sp. NBC_01451 TaxID=2903872 RepID=UPI002E37F439|nr:hypothetical protein [Streptomyces sp. NBC_01451]
MSTSEVDERPPLPHRLVVPTVDTGEVGLVLTVCGVEWERAPHAERRRDIRGYWSVTLENGDRYVLPEGLHGWARSLDSDVRRRLVRLPVVCAFAQHGGAAAARILSAAQNG